MSIHFTAHDCEIEIEGDKIKVLDGVEAVGNNDCHIKDWLALTDAILSEKLQGIMLEYTPEQLIARVKEEIAKNEAKQQASGF